MGADGCCVRGAGFFTILRTPASSRHGGIAAKGQLVARVYPTSFQCCSRHPCTSFANQLRNAVPTEVCPILSPVSLRASRESAGLSFAPLKMNCAGPPHYGQRRSTGTVNAGAPNEPWDCHSPVRSTFSSCAQPCVFWGSGPLATRRFTESMICNALIGILSHLSCRNRSMLLPARYIRCSSFRIATPI